MKKIFFLLLILISRVNAPAQNLKEIHSQIVAAVERKDYAAAVSELAALEKSDEKIFKANNYDYLLARMAEKSGDLATAATNYQAVVNRNSILSEYALRHLSQIARETGNLLLERIYLRELSIVAPNGLTIEAANARMARSYFESKDYPAAIQVIDRQSTVSIEQKDTAINNDLPVSENGQQKTNEKEQQNNPNRKLKINSRDDLALLGQAYLQSGKLDEAREIFTKLINDLPNPAQPDDFALAGAKGLDALDGGAANFGKAASPLSDTEHFRRASIYQFNRNFGLARLHFRAIVERFPQSANVADALFQIGRGFVQENNYNEAINWFERVQAEFPESPISKDALSQTASAYSRVKKPKEAVSRYQKFIEKYPNADNLERAYLNIVDVFRDKGEEVDALKWTAKTQEVFRGKLPEALALFAQARIHIAQNDWQNALIDLDKLLTFPDLGGVRVAGGTNKAEITFLKGFALENLNRYNEAIDVYLSIPDGRGEYYGWRATEKLEAMANGEKTKSSTTQKLAELTQNIETKTADAQRKSAQAALRMTENADIRRRLLEIIKRAYLNLSDYQKIPSGKLLEFGRQTIFKESDEKIANNYHKTLADELLFLGLYDEATPELEISLTENGKRKTETDENNDLNPKAKAQNPKSNDIAYTLAVFYRRGEMANRAVAFSEPLWKKIPADYQIELIPPEQIELLYPAPYADALLQSAAAKQVDPRFMLSITRQESRYRADVKSNAAARGLLQFISTTADRLAAELGRSDFVQDELYNPPTAILFGAQYLSNLFRQFPKQPAAVAASYNGGEDNMTRWLARAKTDNPDSYVPEILFAQSKDYVYKVMANYRVYQMFYDEKLKSR